jgi:lipoprotein-anchoring transpeptidase ErfK/SrfK
MQRVFVTTLVASVAASYPALAQPMPPYYPQSGYQAGAAPYAQPQYPPQPQYVPQYAPQYPPQYVPQPQYAPPPQYGQPLYPPSEYATHPQYGRQPVYPQREKTKLGGGLIEFIFGGGQARQSHAVYQPQPVVPYIPAPAPARPEVHASLPPQRLAVDPRFMRQTVAYDGDEKPGTIIINTPERLLYLVQEGGKALRYGIGVGRPGFTWAGSHEVTAKREWPDWRPPAEMLKRRPDLPRYMQGGPENPLGARALYLGSTLYRIHGSNEPWTIGQQVSSGCIRMRNEDVIDLYERVKVGTKVMVI